MYGELLSLQDGRVCLYNPRDRAVDAHQEGEAVKSGVRYRNDRVSINNRKYVELAVDKDIVGVQVVVGKAKPFQRSILGTYCRS